jgi:predicted ArsR family transcriptional regulator
MLVDKTQRSGRGRPKFQYSSRRPLRIKRRVPHREKSLWESELQSLEKKIACDKRDSGQNTTILLAP